MKKVSFLILFFFIFFVIFADSSISQDRVSRERSEAVSFFEEGIYHFNRKDYIASVNAFMRALYKDPDYYKARYWLGKSYFHSGYVKNALIEWEQVLNLLGGEDYFLKNKIIRLLNQTVDIDKSSFEYNYVETTDFRGKSLSRPVSIYLDRGGYYWVISYTSGSILIFDKNARELASLSSPDYPFKHPYDVVQSKRGDFFVSDFALDRVHRLSRDREYVSSFGVSGLEGGSFMGPSGLALDRHDNLYVVDKGNNRVQKFSFSGEFLMEFGSKGRSSGALLGPSDVLVLGSYIYVTDTGNSRVQVFNSSGNWVRSIGEGELEFPMGIKSLDELSILVADKARGIVRFDLEDFSYGLVKGLDDKLKEPVDFVVDGNNFLYIADLSMSSILSYVPEAMKYTGLDISVLQTFTADHPSIVQKVLVKDQFGRHIIGLNDFNFSVYEQGILHDVVVEARSGLVKDLSLLVVNDMSLSMEGHSSYLKKLMGNIFDYIDYPLDIKVVNFNKSYWQAQDFISSKALTLRSIVGSGYGEGRFIGDALYGGISDLLLHKVDLKGAVLIISSGNLDDASFGSYGYDVCLRYARNNLVPIYVISFGDGGDGDYILKELAVKTGGKYFHAYSPNRLVNLASYIRSDNVGVYYVKHKSRFYGKGSSYRNWRDIRLEVKLKDLFGQDRSEYFFYN